MPDPDSVIPNTVCFIVIRVNPYYNKKNLLPLIFFQDELFGQVKKKVTAKTLLNEQLKQVTDPYILFLGIRKRCNQLKQAIFYFMKFRRIVEIPEQILAKSKRNQKSGENKSSIP